jgi:iron-sulfur cluster assembly protein
MSISLTPTAGAHVRKMLAQNDQALGLRLGTRKSGCTGFAYVVDYADEIAPEDRVFESEGVRVVVDPASLQQLDGTEVDYVTNNVLNKGFEFRNPNVRDSCGCGESFSV